MATSTVGKVYAKALLEVAADRGKIDPFAEEVAAFVDLVGADGTLRLFWESPGVPAEAKRTFIREGLASLSVEIRNFLLLLVEKGRVRDLATILADYRELADEASGRRRVGCEIAVERLDGHLKRLKDHIGKTFGKQVVLETRTRPELIGGMRVRIGDLVLDGTLAHRLKGMRKRLRGDLN